MLLLYDVSTNLLFARDIYAINNLTYFIDNKWPIANILREHIGIFLMLYIAILLLFIRGVGMHLTAFVVFLFTFLDNILIHPAIFWGDYILRFTLLYFIFTDSYRFFVYKPSFGKPGLLHFLSIWSLKIHVVLIYMTNAWYKWWSDDWISGYAIGYFFNSAQVNDIFNIGGFVMQFPEFIRISTWFVLFFQTTFPIFIWFIKIKWFWIFVGILMHAIMAVTLQLYKFELIMVLLYGFFISDREWQYLLSKFNVKLNYGKR